MSTVLTEPIEAPTATPRRRTLNLHVTRAQITAGIVFGTPAVAICGECFVPSTHGDGETRLTGAALCPTCGRIYEQLQAAR